MSEREKKTTFVENFYAMSMLSCPHCGKRISSMAWTCPHCGIEIKGHLVECPHCGNFMLDSQDTCPQCGATNEDYRYGINTSTNTHGEEVVPGDMSKDPRRHGGVWIFVILVLSLCVGGYYAYVRYTEETTAKAEAERRAAMELELSIQQEQARQWKAIADCDSIELLEVYLQENPDSKFAGFAMDRIDSLRLRKARLRSLELEQKVLQSVQEPEELPQEQSQKEQTTEQNQP